MDMKKEEERSDKEDGERMGEGRIRRKRGKLAIIKCICTFEAFANGSMFYLDKHATFQNGMVLLHLSRAEKTFCNLLQHRCDLYNNEPKKALLKCCNEKQ